MAVGLPCPALIIPRLRPPSLQAPKVQKSKEAKALAAANSGKGKKKVRQRWTGGGRRRWQVRLWARGWAQQLTIIPYLAFAAERV